MMCPRWYRREAIIPARTIRGSDERKGLRCPGPRSATGYLGDEQVANAHFPRLPLIGQAAYDRRHLVVDLAQGSPLSRCRSIVE